MAAANGTENILSPESDLQWYVFYTRARHEQRVEERVRHLGVESFVPCLPVQRQWKDRKKIVHWPLFPGYVFILCRRGDISRVVSTAGVVSVVHHNGKPALVRPDELDNVRCLIRLAAPFGGVPERVPLEPGLAVHVTAGPLKGLDGVVIQQRNKRQFVVQLTAIGEGLVLNVDHRFLEARRDRYGELVRC